MVKLLKVLARSIACPWTKLLVRGLEHRAGMVWLWIPSCAQSLARTARGQRGHGWDVTGDLQVLWLETVGLRNLWQFLGKGSLSGPPPWPPGKGLIGKMSVGICKNGINAINVSLFLCLAALGNITILISCHCFRYLLIFSFTAGLCRGLFSSHALNSILFRFSLNGIWPWEVPYEQYSGHPHALVWNGTRRNWGCLSYKRVSQGVNSFCI